MNPVLHLRVRRFSFRCKHALIASDRNPLGAVNAVHVADDRLQLLQGAYANGASRRADGEHDFPVELLKADMVQCVFQYAAWSAVVFGCCQNDAVRILQLLLDRKSVV